MKLLNSVVPIAQDSPQEFLGVLLDDISSKQVRTEVPVDGQTVSKYSFVSHTMDSAAARKSLFYH